MAIGHKFNADELVDIFDQFVEIYVNGELEKETVEFIHETVREMASGYPVYINHANLAKLLTDFISLFEFNDTDGGYIFIWEGIIAQGKTEIIEYSDDH